MKNSAIPKNQHWVPQFYLKQFSTLETRATGREQVWIFSRWHTDDLEPKRVSIRNVASKRFLYSPQAQDGRRSFAGEEMLSDADGKLSQFWPRLATGVLDLDQHQGLRRAIAWFMALSIARHPDQFDAMQRMHEEMVRFYESAPKDEFGRPAITHIEDEGGRRELDNSGWEGFRSATSEDVRQGTVDSIRRLTVALTDDILAKRWTIVVSPHPVFVTSDRPVYLTNNTRERFGTRTPGTMITFPLSPTHILFAHDEPGDERNRYVPLKKGDALGINCLTWVHAKRFLISSYQPTELLGNMVRASERYDRIHENRERVRTTKIGRNERCPCGSGKKSKYCCGDNSR
jgi:hypothetical protein